MRLHTLEIIAFGPFPDKAVVDFDTLSGSGLFLLAGPTGAGKSSVLDAVCFALYGDVPGDRASAKRLRCDTAPPGVPPRVILEATLSGRRFRIERSPSWSRPKRRGTGNTTEQARVVISESVDGSWVTRSTRLDETGHLVTQLVGMNLPQFCQVALLPQGRFQAFLRARSEERHALLQQLFRTGRFDQVERWLRDRRSQLRRASEAHESQVADLVSRLSEVADEVPPDSWSDEPAVLDSWSHRRVATARQRVSEAAALVTITGTALDEARTRHDEGRRIHDLVSRGDDARRDHASLEQAAPGIEQARARLALARRAEGLSPVLRLAREASQTAEVAYAEERAAHAELLALLGDRYDTGDERQVDDHVARALQTWQEVEPVILQLPTSTSEHARAVEAVAAARQEVEKISDRNTALPPELAGVRDAVRRAEASRVESARLATVVADLEGRLSARRRADVIQADLGPARAELESVRAQVVAAKEQWLSVREARLEGMASEIAAALASGCSCPVCGSLDHPSPASTRHGAPDAATERKARVVVDDLEVVLEAHRQQVRDLETQYAVAVSEAGDCAEDLVSDLDAARRALETERVQAEELASLESDLATLEQESRELNGRLTESRVGLAGLEHTLAEAQARVDVAKARIDGVLAEWRATGPDDLRTTFHAVEVAYDRLREARSRRTAAQGTQADAEHAAEREASAAGFADRFDAANAAMPSDDVLRLEQTVTEHEAAVSRVRAVLTDASIEAALATTPRPDVVALAAILDRTRAASAEAVLSLDRAKALLQRLQSLAQELSAARVAWEPLRSELDLTASLASFVEGKSPDNRLQMRLSAYVLAHRLSQVVDAANVRLWSMSSQRYSLVHTGKKGAGETRGGLSLLVRDEWSGESRDPATLSGGESFVVSLALALGLADVIAHEAGGADLHTLFVDEGFGALDADTLDDVMDVLDELRDGGRVVGVVSHVPELRTRIPTQLRVTKGREGSGVSLRVG